MLLVGWLVFSSNSCKTTKGAVVHSGIWVWLVSLAIKLQYILNTYFPNDDMKITICLNTKSFVF